ncbi:MAG: multicopper oxidase domain-containing protein [Chloroflexi bacterium]|nr:multicopper oxidase domain-containing protein [Chloroflexota bacterium]
MHARLFNPLRLSILLSVFALLIGVSGVNARPTLPAPLPAALPASTCTLVGSTRTCELWAKTGSITLPGIASPVTIWGYADSAAGAATSPGPLLIVNEGETIEIVLHNDLADATSLTLPAQDLAPDVTGAAVGSTTTYTFAATRPGTYLYEAGPTANGQRQVAMGLFGALIVRSAVDANSAYGTAASAFDDEAILIFHEIDPAFNADPAGFSFQTYAPRYWLINGQVYSNTAPIDVTAGNRVLLRYVNAGLDQHAIGLLGVRQTVLGYDASPLAHPYTVVAETLPAGQTLDALVTMPSATGRKYPLYDTSQRLHNAGRRSGGVLTAGGLLTFLNVAAGAPGGDTVGPTTSSVAAAPATSDGNVAVDLTAAIDDTASGNSAIGAAEYFIDTPGANGSGTALAAVDGTFDSATENATATLSTGLLATLSSGSHTLYVHGQDAAGNWGVFSAVVITLDKTGPATMSIVLTPNVSQGNADVGVQATGNDAATGNANVTAAEYFIDATGADGTGTALTLNQIAPIASLTGVLPAGTLTGLSEGAHTLYIHSQDAFGNWGAFGSASVLIDRTGPGVTALTAAPTPNNGAQGFNPVTFAVRVDATLNDAAVSGANANLNAAEGFIDTLGAPGTGFPLTPLVGAYNTLTENAYALIPLATVNALPEGAHSIIVRGQDSAGNWGATSSTPLVIDKTLPTVSGASASPNPTVGAASITLAATAADASNIVAAEWFEGGDPGSGNAAPMTATDGSFNSGSEGIQATINVSGWTPGSHTLYLRAKDAAGNWSLVTSVNLTVSSVADLLYFSTLGNTNPPGVGGTADNADTYFWNGTAFSRVFDATANGLPGAANVDGYVRVDATHFYLSFAADTAVPGLGTVQDEDVVFYNAGVWSVYFDGTAQGLTAANQDIDAIDIVGGVLYFSTVGNTNPPGAGGTADNADIYAWNGTSFSRVFDATANGLAGAANVDGFVRVDATHFYLSFATDTAVPGLGTVQDEDVVFYNAGVWSVYFDGTAHGLTAANHDVDAFDLP